MVYCHSEEKWFCKDKCNLIYHVQFQSKIQIPEENNEMDFTYWSKTDSIAPEQLPQTHVIFQPQELENLPKTF